MARPRVFVSSTFYDLRQVRADLFRFIAELGYEPVLNERGAIPYDSTKKLQESAYRSVDLSDILVSIVGGRYGTGSDRSPYSISQVELKTALEAGKPVFIFVEKSTLAEYSTYLKNKGLSGIQYSFADNPQIYAFLEEVHTLPKNNPIASFETAGDITDYLKEQWAGLFQGFLQQRGRVKENQLIDSLTATVETLNQMVKLLAEQRGTSESALQEILFSNHPIFQQLREVTRTPYRLLFYNHTELETWLKTRGYRPVPSGNWDDPEYEEWTRDVGADSTEFLLLKISRKAFDENGKLRIFTKENWDTSWISQETRVETPEPEPAPVSNDDIPF